MQQEQTPETPCFDLTLNYLFESKLSPKLTLAIQFAFILLFVLASFGIGIYLFYLTPNISYTAYNYGGSPDCQSKLGKNESCRITIQVEKKLQAPVHMYYELDNFISNSKEYISSKSTTQLQGKSIDLNSKQAKKCIPYITNKQIGVTKSWAGQNLDPNALASPCGLQAKLFFRDQFELENASTTISISPPQSKRQFARSASSQSTQWLDPTASNFEIWMTTSINKTVSKLYGVINSDLEPGAYTLKIKNVMNYSVFQTKKSVRLTKINNEYGNNKLLGALFIGGGAALLVISVLRFVYDILLLKKSD